MKRQEDSPHAVRRSHEKGSRRRRNAAQTRLALLEAARRRFAFHGYAATTVREIADDVGVNVALISRYFGSKEGLLEACLREAVRDFRRSAGQSRVLAEVFEEICTAAVRVTSEGGLSEVLLMLLRPSGDKNAERMRIGTLQEFATGIARAAGWNPDRPGADELLLRAQLVLSAAAGIVTLRSSPGMEPLTSAREEELIGPLRDLVTGVLGQGKMT